MTTDPDDLGPFVHLIGDGTRAVLVCARDECDTFDHTDLVMHPWHEYLPPGASPEYAVHRANTHRSTHPGDQR